MDVTLNTNYFPVSKADLNSAKINPNTTENIAAENIEHEFNYTDVLMGLEELQNFLFMLIGAEIPDKNAGSDKGNKLNIFA